MDDTYDLIIVGAGLAGACAALWTSAARRVLVVEAVAPAAGASGAAAGLVNPLISRRPRLAPDGDAALAALHATMAAAGAASLFRGGGILRPAADPDQADRFREAARTFPDHGVWWPPDEVRARHAAVAAPHGALLVTQGGAVEVPRLVRALLDAAQARGADLWTARATAWEAHGDHVALLLVRDGVPVRVRAGHVLLAIGGGYEAFPALGALPLHRVKGQTIRVAPPPGLDLGALPHLAGHGYLAVGDDALVLGSTYEHTFDDLRPTAAATREILDKTARLLPALRGARVLDAAAGVRVTTPAPRRPRLGPLPGSGRVWAFVGLGSKGLLTAPLLARRLPAYLDDPAALPPDVRVEGA